MTNLRSESGSGYMVNASSTLLMNETIESLITRSHNLYCEVDAMTENKTTGFHHQYALKAGMSSDKQHYSSSADLTASSSSPNCFGGKVRKSKVLMTAGHEVRRLNERMRSLEEEAKIIKETFLGSVEERKKLMNEIYQQFQVIHHRLRLINQVAGHGDNLCDGVLIINPTYKEGRKGTGLSQALCQELNPSLVIRDLRANLVAFQDLAEFTNGFSNR